MLGGGGHAVGGGNIIVVERLEGVLNLSFGGEWVGDAFKVNREFFGQTVGVFILVDFFLKLSGSIGDSLIVFIFVFIKGLGDFSAVLTDSDEFLARGIVVGVGSEGVLSFARMGRVGFLDVNRGESDRFEVTVGGFDAGGWGFANIEEFAKRLGLAKGREGAGFFGVGIVMGRGHGNRVGVVAVVIVVVLRGVAKGGGLAGHLADTNLGRGIDSFDGGGNLGGPLVVGWRTGGLAIAVRFVGKFVAEKSGVIADGGDYLPDMRQVIGFIVGLIPGSGIAVDTARKDLAAAVAIIG